MNHLEKYREGLLWTESRVYDDSDIIVLCAKTLSDLVDRIPELCDLFDRAD